MKACIAQTKPIKGNIKKNIENHIKLIELAIANNVDIIVFPELSITGYEAELAEELATTAEDKRFDIFQDITDANSIVIAIGLPIRKPIGICIGLAIFQPNEPRTTYSKKHLHPGEEKYFVPGENGEIIKIDDSKIGFAICYETSIQEHTNSLCKNGIDIYMASVLDTVGGVDKDLNRISNTAKKQNITALMANFVGKSGGYDCAGKSSIWNTNGLVLEQLDDINEGIAIMNTKTQETFKIQL